MGFKTWGVLVKRKRLPAVCVNNNMCIGCLTVSFLLDLALSNTAVLVASIFVLTVTSGAHLKFLLNRWDSLWPVATAEANGTQRTADGPRWVTERPRSGNTLCIFVRILEKWAYSMCTIDWWAINQEFDEWAAVVLGEKMLQYLPYLVSGPAQTCRWSALHCSTLCKLPTSCCAAAARCMTDSETRTQTIPPCSPWEQYTAALEHPTSNVLPAATSRSTVVQFGSDLLVTQCEWVRTGLIIETSKSMVFSWRNKWKRTLGLRGNTAPSGSF